MMADGLTAEGAEGAEDEGELLGADSDAFLEPLMDVKLTLTRRTTRRSSLPWRRGADASCQGVVARPIEFSRPGGGFAVFVVEVEEGAVVLAAGGVGKALLQEAVEVGCGAGVNGDS